MKKIAQIVAVAMFVSAGIASAAEAKENWEKLCAKCHGANGKGDTKIGQKLHIKDLTDAKVQAVKDEEMFKALKEGVKVGDTTRMKAVEGISDDEMKDLVKYVRGLKK